MIEPIYIEVDDASHLLDPSRASFEMLLPRLRPNGLYILEDWCEVHRGPGDFPPDNSMSEYIGSIGECITSFSKP